MQDRNACNQHAALERRGCMSYMQRAEDAQELKKDCCIQIEEVDKRRVGNWEDRWEKSF
jgi:hypothetical protein